MRVFFASYKIVAKFSALNKYKKRALKVKVLKSHPVLRVQAGNALPLSVFAICYSCLWMDRRYVSASLIWLHPEDCMKSTNFTHYVSHISLLITHFVRI